MFNPRKLASLCLELLPRLEHMTVIPEAVEACAARLCDSPPAWPRWSHPSFFETPGAQLDTQVWLGNALNFYYWVQPGEHMWAVEVAGQLEPDAFGLFGCLRQAMESGLDLADARVLHAEAPRLFELGAGTLPLLHRRVAILREVAAVLGQQFDGRLDNALRAAGQDAPGMAGFLARTFPSYQDTRLVGGVTLPLLKRAQLAAGMLHARRLALGAPGFSGADRLTAYADYMLPRVLRHLGVLVYSDELARRVDDQEELPLGDPAEAELRVATVGACELLVQAVNVRGVALCAGQLDYWLWREGFGVKAPHHRTVTTDY